MKATLMKGLASDGEEIFRSDKPIRGELGDLYHAELKRVKDRRSYDQLKLYWQACKYVAHNCPEGVRLHTEKMVDFWAKCELRLVDGWVYITNPKTGETMLQLIPGSVAFDTLPHLEATGYFSNAFDLMADILNMESDEFILAVKDSVGKL